MRKTRGLGLGAAVRTFNDRAVPGLGGLWFAKPILWSLLGVHIGNQTGARPAQVANAIEALACWHALISEDGERSPRIGGRTKLKGLPNRFVAYAKASRREFYVTVPMRQGMVQPLRELGLVVDGVQRFNAYEVTDAGEELLEAACKGFRPGKRDLVSALTLWVRGSRDDAYVYSDIMRRALSPMTPLRGAAASLLRERLLTGRGDGRRRAIRAWVRSLKPSATMPVWAERPAEIDNEHWSDLREGARFFLMRDAAIHVLDGVEGALGSSASAGLQLADAAKAVSPRVANLRASASLFASADHDPTGGLTMGFAKQCMSTHDADVVRALVELDGRGLRLDASTVRPGSAFGAGPGVDTDGAEPAEADGPAVATLPLPTGISGRVRNMYSLDVDIDAAIAESAEGES